MRNHDTFRIKSPCRNNFIHFGDYQFGGLRHNQVEIACGLAKDQIAQFIGLVGEDQCNIRRNRLLQQVFPALEGPRLPVARKFRAHSRRRVKPCNSDTGTPDSLRERTLWNQIHRDFPGVIGLGHLRIPVVIIPHKPFDFPRRKKGSKSHTGRAEVVADDRQIRRIDFCKRLNEALRIACVAGGVCPAGGKGAESDGEEDDEGDQPGNIEGALRHTGQF